MTIEDVDDVPEEASPEDATHKAQLQAVTLEAVVLHKSTVVKQTNALLLQVISGGFNPVSVFTFGNSIYCVGARQVMVPVEPNDSRPNLTALPGVENVSEEEE